MEGLNVYAINARRACEIGAFNAPKFPFEASGVSGLAWPGSRAVHLMHRTTLVYTYIQQSRRVKERY